MPLKDDGLVDAAGQPRLLPLNKLRVIVQPTRETSTEDGRVDVGATTTALGVGLATPSATSEVKHVDHAFIVNVSCSTAGSGRVSKSAIST